MMHYHSQLIAEIGGTVVRTSLYGEYMTVRAPVFVVEKLLNTRLHWYTINGFPKVMNDYFDDIF